MQTDDNTKRFILKIVFILDDTNKKLLDLQLKNKEISKIKYNREKKSMSLLVTKTINKYGFKSDNFSVNEAYKKNF